MVSESTRTRASKCSNYDFLWERPKRRAFRAFFTSSAALRKYASVKY